MSTFIFGKLPAHGDFVARGLDERARAIWDKWLTRELVLARSAHGAEFEARYQTAPAWHFAIEMVNRTLAGCLALSVDAAGRRFPVVAGRDPGDAVESVATACEDCLYDAIAGNWTADVLNAAIGAISVEPEEAEEIIASRWWTPGNSTFPEDCVAGTWPEGLLTRMLGLKELKA